MNDWVGFMAGHPQAITPNIDSLANQGVAFRMCKRLVHAAHRAVMLCCMV
jgi:hypothetical protein